MRQRARHTRRVRFVIGSVWALLVMGVFVHMTATGEASSGYQITDLGTLHGDIIYPSAISSSGAVAGTGWLPGDIYRRAFVYKDGVVTVLGTFGGTISGACCVNASGQVAGFATFADDLVGHAFIYNGGSFADLGTLGGGSASWPSAMNDAGQVVGTSFTGDPAVQHAFFYSGGSLIDMGTLGGNVSEPRAINSSGQATGYSTLTSGARHAFVYSGGTLHDLGTLGGFNSDGYAINSSGQVAGWSYSPQNDAHAMMYSNGVMTDIGTLGGTISQATGINDAGQVIGNSEYAPDSYYSHAFLYSGGVLTDLSTMAGWGPSGATGINASGQVVGWADSGAYTYHAFLYSNGVMTDLNTFMSADSGWELQLASAINDKGQIVGYGTLNGEVHAFLLTPTRSSYTTSVQSPIKADGSSVFNASRGVVPVKFALAVDGAATCELPPASIAVTRVAGATGGQLNENTYLTAADAGSNFRISDCQYVYNLAASALGAGSYRAEIKIDGNTVGQALFTLK